MIEVVYVAVSLFFAALSGVIGFDAGDDAVAALKQAAADQAAMAAMVAEMTNLTEAQREEALAVLMRSR